MSATSPLRTVRTPASFNACPSVEVSAKFSGGKAESFELISAEDKCVKVEIKDAATVSCGDKEYKAVDGLFELCVKSDEKLECTVMY